MIGRDVICCLWRAISCYTNISRVLQYNGLSVNESNETLCVFLQVLGLSRFKARTSSTKSARSISTKSTTKWWVYSYNQECSLYFTYVTRRGCIKRYLPSARCLRIRRRAELIFRIIGKVYLSLRYLHLTRTWDIHAGIVIRREELALIDVASALPVREEMSLWLSLPRKVFSCRPKPPLMPSRVTDRWTK